MDDRSWPDRDGGDWRQATELPAEKDFCKFAVRESQFTFIGQESDSHGPAPYEPYGTTPFRRLDTMVFSLRLRLGILRLCATC